MVAVASVPKRKRAVPHKWRGERLKTLREAAKESRATLGKVVGKSDVAVLYWETGRSDPGGETVFDLARYYGVEAKSFYDWEDPLTPSDGGDD